MTELDLATTAEFYTYLVLFVLSVLQFIVTTGWVVRRDYHPLKRRLVLVKWIENTTFLIGVIFIYWGRMYPETLPCWMFFFFTAWGFSVGCSAFSCRAFYFYYVYNWHMDAVKYGDVHIITSAQTLKNFGSSSSDILEADKMKKLKQRRRYTEGFFLIRCFYISIFFGILYGIPMLILQDFASLTLAESDCRLGLLSPYLVLAIVTALFGVVAFKARFLFVDKEDNFGMYKDFSILYVNCYMVTVMNLICIIPPVFNASRQYYEFVDLLAFGLASSSGVFEVGYPLSQTWSDYYLRKGNIEDPSLGLNKSSRAPSMGGNSNRMSPKQLFLSVIDTHEGFEAFQQYLIKEFAVESLLFWYAARRYHLDMALREADDIIEDSLDDILRNIDAIYRSFIHEDAVLMVNISWGARHQIDIAMESVTTDPMKLDLASIFAAAEEETLKLMLTDSFRRFRTSDEYSSLKLQETI